VGGEGKVRVNQTRASQSVREEIELLPPEMRLGKKPEREDRREEKEKRKKEKTIGKEKIEGERPGKKGEGTTEPQFWRGKKEVQKKRR